MTITRDSCKKYTFLLKKQKHKYKIMKFAFLKKNGNTFQKTCGSKM